MTHFYTSHGKGSGPWGRAGVTKTPFGIVAQTCGATAKQAGIRGTGIGLATVQYIVAAHHGELRLESKAGEGSAFTLLLPAVN